MSLRTIRALVAGSTQSGVIIEKLDLIASHPNNLEENQTLATAILELVQNDSSLSNSYKSMLESELAKLIALS